MYMYKSLVSFILRNLMTHDNNLLQQAHIKIDGSKNPAFRNAMRSYLRAYLGVGKIHKMKIVDSRKDNLIQLADMVAGAG